MQCKLCDNATREIFKHRVLNKYLITYFSCDTCGLIQTEKPYWLKESYKNPINSSDTGYAIRNIFFARRTTMIFPLLFGVNKCFLDYAGGYGLLTRLMRDYGLNFVWADLYTPNLFAQGFTYGKQKITAITCFECFEHFVSPTEELEKMLIISKNIFFSTQALPSPVPAPEQWEYYGFSHGQHISFYSIKTLQFLADKYNLRYYTNGSNLHLFSENKISSIYFKIAIWLSRLPVEFLLKRIFGSRTIIDNRNLIENDLR